MTYRTCAQCPNVFKSPSAARLYCSELCKSRAKWDRRKAVYHQERAAGTVPRIRAYQKRRRAALGIQTMQTGITGECAHCGDCFAGVLGKVYCSPTCRRRSKYDAENRNSTTVIMGTASLHGALFPKPKPIKVRLTCGVMAHCPWCESFMTAASPTYRACLNCGTTVELNQEEVEWAISERRSIEARKPTPN